MFWTLVKILVFVGVVVAGAYGAGLVLDSGQTVGLRVFDVEFELGPMQSLIGLVALFVAVWLVSKLLGLLWAFLRFLNGDETAVRRFFTRNREKRGLDALLGALIAQAEGDGKLAVAKAQKAHKLLNRPLISGLLIGQAAEMKGNHAMAIDAYKGLLDDNRSRFTAIQGLIRVKLDQGDTEKARALAVKALEIQPAHEPTQDTLLKLQMQAEDWSGARKTLQIKKSSGRLPRDVYIRRDAVLALQHAGSLAARGDIAASRETAIDAARLSPTLIPAALAAARAQIAAGDGAAAARTIKKAWKAQPHPELAAVFAMIVPDERPAERVKRFTALTSVHADSPETMMLKAELLITAEDFPAARRALGDLATTRPTIRALTIMAAIERGEGADDSVVRGWLTRALAAPRGATWVCTNCLHEHTEWQAECDNCNAFDTLEWREVAVSTGASPTGTELLPLIAGHVSDPAPDAEIISSDSAQKPA